MYTQYLQLITFIVFLSPLLWGVDNNGNDKPFIGAQKLIESEEIQNDPCNTSIEKSLYKLKINKISLPENIAWDYKNGSRLDCSLIFENVIYKFDEMGQKIALYNLPPSGTLEIRARDLSLCPLLSNIEGTVHRTINFDQKKSKQIITLKYCYK